MKLKQEKKTQIFLSAGDSKKSMKLTLQEDTVGTNEYVRLITHAVGKFDGIWTRGLESYGVEAELDENGED